MAVEVAVARRRFTRAEYHRMGEVGILTDTDRVELIEGEIVTMSPIGRRHYAFLDNLTRLLVLGLGERAVVSVQGPVTLSDETEVQPDLAVYRRRPVSYKDADRGPADALLVVEVAEASLAYDRSIKLRLYAAAGIGEYWIVDCAAETVDVHRVPAGGSYRAVTRLAGTATVALQAFPDVVLPVRAVFS